MPGITFPGRMATITTSTALTGPLGDTGVSQRQRLVVVPGQFVADAIDDERGIGTQTLFGRVAGRILYSSSDDFDPPQLNAIDGVITGGSQAAFAVDAGDATPASSRCWCCSTRHRGARRSICSAPTGAGKVPPPCRAARAPCATSSRPSTPPATSASAATRASRSPARRASSSRRRRLRARTWR